jgi:hypothetical protein
MSNASKGEPPPLRADVIVVADRITPAVLSGIQNALEGSGPILSKLIVVTRFCHDSELESLVLSDPRITISPQVDERDDVEACNRALAHRTGDVALLPATANVSAGWLTELSAAAHSEERTAFAWPLSNAEFGTAQPATGDETDAGTYEADFAVHASTGLPRSTTTSSIRGDCVYLRGQVLDAIGLLDNGLSTRQAAIMDWVMRAQALGFFGKRANHVYVDRASTDCGAVEQSSLIRTDRAVLDQRHPHLAHQAASFDKSNDGRLAQHAINFLKTGTIRVAYDIRHVDSRNVGLRDRAIELAEALTKIPQIELSFLVNTRDEADGLNGRIIMGEEWCDEFAVIHKPAQFLNRRELEIPFNSSSHVVITCLGSIAQGDPMGFGDEADFDACGTTSALSLLCASGIVVHSAGSREEIASELGIPAEEIAVAPLENAARSTFEVYRSAVLRPTERSLQMRRLLREAILSWSRPSSVQSPLREGNDTRVANQAMGVRAAWKSLGAAVGRRVGREARRFHSRQVRSRA